MDDQVACADPNNPVTPKLRNDFHNFGGHCHKLDRSRNDYAHRDISHVELRLWNRSNIDLRDPLPELRGLLRFQVNLRRVSTGLVAGFAAVVAGLCSIRRLRRGLQVLSQSWGASRFRQLSFPIQAWRWCRGVSRWLQRPAS